MCPSICSLNAWPPRLGCSVDNVKDITSGKLARLRRDCPGIRNGLKPSPPSFTLWGVFLHKLVCKMHRALCIMWGSNTNHIKLTCLFTDFLMIFPVFQSAFWGQNNPLKPWIFPYVASFFVSESHCCPEKTTLINTPYFTVKLWRSPLTRAHPRARLFRFAQKYQQCLSGKLLYGS